MKSEYKTASQPAKPHRLWRYLKRLVILYLFVYFAYPVASILDLGYQMSEAESLYFASPERGDDQLKEAFLSKTAPSEQIASEKQGLEPQASYLIEDENYAALKLRLSLIAKAKKSIDFCVYDIVDDESFESLRNALIQAADRGVQVRIIADGFAAGYHLLKSPWPARLASHPKIEWYYYNPLSLWPQRYQQHRMHDKIVLVDDRYLLISGRNIAMRFLSDQYEGGPPLARDLDLLCVIPEGPSLSRRSIEEAKAHFEGLISESESIPGLKPEFDSDWLSGAMLDVPESIYPLDERLAPCDAFIFLSNSPELGMKDGLLFQDIYDFAARRQEELEIYSPYLNFSTEMMRASEELRERIPSLKFYCNSVAVCDNVVAASDYLIRSEALANLASEIYENQSPPSQHMKAFLLGDEFFGIGSFNFDMRSSFINSESLLLVRGKAAQVELSEHLARAASAYVARSEIIDAEDADKALISTCGVETDLAKMSWQKRLSLYCLWILQPIRFLI
ncbi:MAG: phosphatidylserine/phosphatidylglycerophosphate/cardiolipin synthase family protein [Eubacteriales bacterium]|nr:phosphatidylserine/phosphatidylglycerophosphate/cardiolipin synthase family protein [Eubacteriales bacterium]